LWCRIKQKNVLGPKQIGKPVIGLPNIIYHRKPHIARIAPSLHPLEQKVSLAGTTLSATACTSLRYQILDSIKFWTPIDALAASGINFAGEASFLDEERMACDVDTGAVFKHPVQCFGCDQAFYFTLRKIAEAEKLACPLCGSDINLTDEAYGSVVTSVKETIALIDQGSRSVQRTSIASPR